MNIVVTGFEPFGGAQTNASWESVKVLPGVTKRLLPVAFSEAATAVREIVDSRPDAVICVGEAGGRAVICIERVAINLMDARIPDNTGVQPIDQSIVPDGPEAYFATLPTRRIFNRIRESDIPADLSYTAGTYVCNSTFYALMHAIDASGQKIMGGFIHVPAQGMESHKITEALKLAVDALKETI